MREIKFRAWDNVEKEFIGQDYFNLIDFVGNTYQFSLGKLNQEISFELMQFTGLKDKNGVEIYEGDVITHNVYIKESGRLERSEPKEIFWDIEKSGWETNRTGYSSGLFYDNYEIIGNIYSNPELLTPNPMLKQHLEEINTTTL